LAKKRIKRKYKRKSRNLLPIAAVICIIIIIILLINLLSTPSVAAIVNGEKITEKEVDDYYDRIPEQFQQFITKYDILEQLINEKVLLQEASKQNITVTDDEINTIINNVIQQSGLTKKEFEQRLKEQDLTMEKMFEYYKTQLTITKLLNKTILSNMNSSDQYALTQAVQLYLEQLKANSEIKIFMTNPSTELTTNAIAQMSAVENCISNYNITKDTIIFIHSNYCPHCQKMIPIVQELEQEGYSFYWAETSDQEANEMMNNCLSSLMTGYVPQFICPATKEEHTGEMSKEDLREFAESC